MASPHVDPPRQAAAAATAANVPRQSPLSDLVADLLGRLARQRFGVRLLTAGVLAWAWVTILSLTGNMAREVMLDLSRGVYYPPTFGPQRIDPVAAARALGGVIMALPLFWLLGILWTLTKRMVRVVHYLVTDRFDFRPSEAAEPVPESIDPAVVREELSDLLESARQWVGCYLLTWVLMIVINILLTVFTVVSPAILPPPPNPFPQAAP
jgi:hypothetical protein